MKKYAEECVKADVVSRQPPLSAEEMREQIRRGKGKKMDAAREEMEGVANSFNSRNSNKGSNYATTLRLGGTPNGFGFALIF